MNAALPGQALNEIAAWDNPMGTDGFEFIEYAAPDPVAMGRVFEGMGFKPVARHRHKNVLLYRQGGINFLINAEPDSFAQRFARLHGPSVCAIAFRVHDAKAAYERAVSLGAWGYAGKAGPGELNASVFASSSKVRRRRCSNSSNASATTPAMSTDRKFNRMRPSMARVLGLETRSAKEG
jgi:4-hydroxyphenylpyruvate dioxygenase-like putative hemolysin